MCNPVAAIAIGSALAGTAMQVQGQRQATRAQNDVASAERIRQDGSRARSIAFTDTAREGASRGTTDQAMAQSAAERAVDYRAAAPVPAAQGGYLPGQGGGPQVVRDEVDRQRGLAAAFSNQQAGARANLGGWSDALFGARTGIARAGQGAAQESSFSRGSASLLPGDMQAAAQRGANWRMAGDLVAGGGNLAAGTYGGPNGWGSLFSSAPAAPVGAFARATTGRAAGPV
jgi:hypothetical protein